VLCNDGKPEKNSPIAGQVSELGLKTMSKSWNVVDQFVSFRLWVPKFLAVDKFGDGAFCGLKITKSNHHLYHLFH
jgi:hypothetical protein